MNPFSCVIPLQGKEFQVFVLPTCNGCLVKWHATSDKESDNFIKSRSSLSLSANWDPCHPSPCYPCTRPLRLAWAVGPCHCQRCDCHINIDSWLHFASLIQVQKIQWDLHFIQFIMMLSNPFQCSLFMWVNAYHLPCLSKFVWRLWNQQKFLESDLQVHVAFLHSSELRKSVLSQGNIGKLIPLGQMWEIFDWFWIIRVCPKLCLQVPSVAAVPGRVSAELRFLLHFKKIERCVTSIHTGYVLRRHFANCTASARCWGSPYISRITARFHIYIYIWSPPPRSTYLIV